ncbi:hypothetical protein [Pseudomonas sp. A-1]|jgi:hypothetical protein|uniref:hypothetical protein n=1 Tax=Pseudomonas sp. A-1 TaxID=1821274 RepID=UPI0014551DF2|nr:hypothetical protein [Pseudomonas sp. A-1]
MSAYITLMTPMMDEECLIASIIDQGLSAADIERAADPVVLRGWQKGLRANIVLRKENTGDAYNDVGFLRTTTGYKAILSDDSSLYGQQWLARVGVSYQRHMTAKLERLAAEERRRLEEERQRLVEAQRTAVHEKARKLGYQVKESREKDVIRLVLVKRTY